MEQIRIRESRCISDGIISNVPIMSPRRMIRLGRIVIGPTIQFRRITHVRRIIYPRQISRLR